MGESIVPDSKFELKTTTLTLTRREFMLSAS